MINPELVARVAEVVAGTPASLSDGDLQRALREHFAGLRVVVCNDDDVPPRVSPVFANVRCNLYYLDASEHCVTLTGDAGAASGLVVGRLTEDVD
ncbi:MAG: DUF6129 family protein [Candidatus Accumulibacter sp. UW26]|jgi:hypothetical protein